MIFESPPHLVWARRYYRDSFEQGGEAGLAHPSGAQYAEPLMSSSQLLPRWQNGKVSWMTPQEARCCGRPALAPPASPNPLPQPRSAGAPPHSIVPLSPPTGSLAGPRPQRPR